MKKEQAKTPSIKSCSNKELEYCLEALGDDRDELTNQENRFLTEIRKEFISRHGEESLKTFLK